jgi:hypothetical protein
MRALLINSLELQYSRICRATQCVYYSVQYCYYSLQASLDHAPQSSVMTECSVHSSVYERNGFFTEMTPIMS